MGAIQGLVLVCLSVFLFTYFLDAKRAPAPARWTQSLPLTVAIMFGLGLVVIVGIVVAVQFFYVATYDEFGVLEIPFFCAIVATTVMACREIRAPSDSA